MKKINITIPEPCHENWNAMTALEKGKFCGACQKKVHDFTKATDREIITAYEKDQKLCGRFLTTQLERDLIIPEEKKSIWLASLFFGLLAFSSAKTIAQTKPNIEQAPTQPEIMGKMIAPQHQNNGKKIISGMVSDSNGPLPSATITIKGTTTEVFTSFDGKYSIKAKEGDVLIYSFMGMNDVSKTVGESNIINIVLYDTSKTLGEVVVGGAVSGIQIKQQSFFSSILTKIKNWFK